MNIHIYITCTSAYSTSRLRDVRWRDTRSTHTHTHTYIQLYPYTHKAPILISLAPAQHIPPALPNTCMHTHTVQTHACKHTNTYLLRCHRRWCAHVRLELQRWYIRGKCVNMLNSYDIFVAFVWIYIMLNARYSQQYTSYYVFLYIWVYVYVYTSYEIFGAFVWKCNMLYARYSQ